MDWKTIISELCALGLTQMYIAAQIGVRQSTVAGLLNGAQKDMRWSNGERLKALYERTAADHPECRWSVLRSDAEEPTHA